MLILEFFGEHFPRERCKATCDNCIAMRGCAAETKDCTEQVVVVVVVVGVVVVVLVGVVVCGVVFWDLAARDHEVRPPIERETTTTR